MLELISSFIRSDVLSTHGMCLLWRPELIWTSVSADAVIGVAYYSIPFVLAYIAYRRPDFGFGGVLWFFVAFILVRRFSQIDGYRCLSLIRALAVVNCQSALA